MRVAFAFTALVMTFGMAQGQDEPDCKDPMDQSTMNMCAHLDFVAADAKLNDIWPTLRDEAKMQDTELAKGKTEYFDALLASQRAWITYRDAECVRQGFEAHGGSMEPMLVSGCMATLTEARIKDLQSGAEQP